MKELVRFEDAGLTVVRGVWDGVRMVRIDGCERPARKSSVNRPPKALNEGEVQELVTVLVEWMNGDDR